ncbi:MAG: molybdate ABC transporter substrate-binding protein [Thermodesulfobacteriota bacterium]
MKYWFLSIFILVPTFAFSAEIYWHVAAAMSRPGEAVVQRYNNSQDTHEVVLITGGSGQLISKIRASGRADLYLPASRHFFRQAQEYGLVHAGTPLINLWPVFGLNPKSKSTYATLEDLGSPGTRLALGNSKTMALGALFERIEAKLPPELAAQLRRNTLVDSMNIQQNVSYLHQGIVDAALLFSSVAKANNFPYVEIPRRWNVAAQAVLVELTTSSNPRAAADFAAFVCKQEDVFSKYGFDVVQ